MLSYRLFVSSGLCYKPLVLDQKGKVQGALVSWFKATGFLVGYSHVLKTGVVTTSVFSDL